MYLDLEEFLQQMYRIFVKPDFQGFSENFCPNTYMYRYFDNHADTGTDIYPSSTPTPHIYNKVD